VQFDPMGTGRILFNREGFLERIGQPSHDRIWCLEPDGLFRPLSPQPPGEWRSHENWAPDGKSLVYHGGRDGKAFVAARTWDGRLLQETSLEEITFWHATAALDGRRLFVEIKCHGSAAETARCRDQLVPELVRVLEQHPAQAKQVVLITFSFEVAQAAKEKLPRVPVCWLFEWKIKPGDSDSPRVDDLIAKVKAAHLDGLDLHYNSPIDGEFVHKIRAAHLLLYVWTVDDPVVARRLAAAGVDGLTTNRPRWLRQQLGHPAPAESKGN